MKRHRHQRPLPAALAAAALALAGGCRSAAPPPRPATPSAGEVRSVDIGRIARVQEAHPYVIVQCVSLPSIGEAARVYRKGHLAGKLRVCGPFESPFVAAEIVQGRPRVGDRVTVDRRLGGAAAEEKKETEHAGMDETRSR
jgi:hypothetical protein